jgi:thioredoxin 1
MTATTEGGPVATVTLTAENHDETVGQGITLIDFWAAWCGPCRQFGPIFERVSEANPDATFAKVDTEDQQQLAAMYGISSIPMLVIYRDGIPVFGQPGALPQEVLEDLLAQVRSLDMDEVRRQYAEQLAAARSAADRDERREA